MVLRSHHKDRDAVYGAIEQQGARFVSINATLVVYVATGGRIIGEAIAAKCNLPLKTLDIRYPVSRLFSEVPMVIRPILWCVKEILYRLSSPACGDSHLWDRDMVEGPIILVDDSASSGKTLDIALAILQRNGISRERITVVVGRCGKRAKELVDVVLF